MLINFVIINSLCMYTGKHHFSKQNKKTLFSLPKREEVTYILQNSNYLLFGKTLQKCLITSALQVVIEWSK